MIIKIVILALLGVVIYMLGSALVFMFRERSESDKMARALSWRIGISVLIFATLIGAYFMGWIQPHGL